MSNINPFSSHCSSFHGVYLDQATMDENPIQEFSIEVSPDPFDFLSVFDYEKYQRENADEILCLDPNSITYEPTLQTIECASHNLYRIELRTTDETTGEDRIFEWNIQTGGPCRLSFSKQNNEWTLTVENGIPLSDEEADAVIEGNEISLRL